MSHREEARHRSVMNTEPLRPTQNSSSNILKTIGVPKHECFRSSRNTFFKQVFQLLNSVPFWSEKAFIKRKDAVN